MTTLKLHPSIEVGTITGLLCVAGEELIYRIRIGDRDRILTGRLIADRFVLSGGLHGEHSLDARAAITPAKRLMAHWRGYCENNERIWRSTGSAS